VCVCVCVCSLFSGSHPSHHPPRCDCRVLGLSNRYRNLLMTAQCLRLLLSLSMCRLHASSWSSPRLFSYVLLCAFCIFLIFSLCYPCNYASYSSPTYSKPGVICYLHIENAEGYVLIAVYVFIYLFICMRVIRITKTIWWDDWLLSGDHLIRLWDQSGQRSRSWIGQHLLFTIARSIFIQLACS